MRVLLLAPQPFYQNRGTPIAVKLLAEVLGQNGIEVHLLVFHEGEDVQMDNVTIHRIPAFPGISSISPGFSLKKIVCDALMWWCSLQLLRKMKFDLVHAVEESVFIAQLNKLCFKVPYIYDMDSFLSDQLLSKLTWLKPLRGFFEKCENNAIRGSLGVVVVCKALESKVRQLMADKLLVRLEDISLLDECSGMNAAEESLRSSLGFKGKVILYVGNLESYQGIDLLLDGFSRLPDDQPDCSLVIIGGSPQDMDKYKRVANELKLSGKVFFTGPRPLNLLGYFLRQADVLVSPRIEGENTPMKIYSYMDSGKPIVATRIESHTQVLDESISVLAEPDAESFAGALSQVLGNEEKGIEFAQRAKEKIAREFSRPVFEQKILGFYNSVKHQLHITP